MMIKLKELYVTNFKSIDEMSINFNNFNVIIGANASGKSNIIQVLKFLNDIELYGIENAISLQGGSEYLRNVNIKSEKNTRIKVDVEINSKFRRIVRGENGKKKYKINMEKITFEFAIKYYKRNQKFKVISDELIIDQRIYKILNDDNNDDDIDEGLIKTKVYKGAKKYLSKIVSNMDDIDIEKEILLSPFFVEYINQSNKLLLQDIDFILPPNINSIFGSFIIYDFDPKKLKKISSISGKNDLEPDGSNLAIVLKKITEDKKKSNVFSNLIQDLLPFVNEVKVDKFIDKSFLFKYKEKYADNNYFPSSIMSDGTVSITALIVAIFFEDKHLMVFEEPERNIHPYLLSKIIELMKDASSDKQILITSHNAEVIKYAGLENLIFVARCAKGYTTVSKPINNKKVKIFLENELGVDELYTQNLLGE